MNQSVGGAKTGVPGEKPPDTPASRTWLVPHVTRAPSEARTHSGETKKNNSVFVTFVFYNKLLTKDVVNFEQLGPVTVLPYLSAYFQNFFCIFCI